MISRRLPLLIVLFAIAAAASLSAQHAQDGKDKKAHPAIGNLEAIAAGKKTFSTGCAVCHGPEGQGGRGPRLSGGAMWHSLDEQETFQLVRNGVGSGMPGSSLPDQKVWELVAFVKNLRDPAAESSVPGDAKAGSEIFWAKAGCGGCHSVSGEGGKLGPDLSNIGAVRSVPSLREAILDPDADGAFGYRPTKIVLNDGSEVRGVLRNLTNYSMQIQDEKGKLYLIDVRNVKDWARGDGSPMPRDYGKKLSPAEIDNLIAYLARLTTRK
jgi:cytochrome c oxidase cbb3-type subunit III